MIAISAYSGDRIGVMLTYSCRDKITYQMFCAAIYMICIVYKSKPFVAFHSSLSWTSIKPRWRNTFRNSQVQTGSPSRKMKIVSNFCHYTFALNFACSRYINNIHTTPRSTKKTQEKTERKPKATEV